MVNCLTLNAGIVVPLLMKHFYAINADKNIATYTKNPSITIALGYLI